MKERPILFNGEMVRAILDGRKTMTRRILKPQPDTVQKGIIGPLNGAGNLLVCKHGNVGGRLWVRETAEIDLSHDSVELGKYVSDGAQVLYGEVEDPEYRGSCAHWWYSKNVCPSIHMPRWASRITLEITDVRVERLQDISEEDAKAEGLRFHPLYNEWGGVEKHPDSTVSVPQWRWYEKPVTAFQGLWQSINGLESWDSNPWVWVIEFKRVDHDKTP